MRRGPGSLLAGLILLTIVGAVPRIGLAQGMADVPIAGVVDAHEIRDTLETYRATGGVASDPPTSLADTPAVVDGLRDAEMAGADLDRVRDLSEKVEPEGTIDLQNFDPAAYTDPREMHQALVERLRLEGFPEKVIEALERGEVDKSVHDWLIEQGGDPEYVEAFVRKEPATEKWILDQAHRYGVPATQYQLSTESDLRTSLPDSMYQAGKSEKEVEALRATE